HFGSIERKTGIKSALLHQIFGCLFLFQSQALFLGKLKVILKNIFTRSRRIACSYFKIWFICFSKTFKARGVKEWIISMS
ncbi:hypothetical protein, partial [Compostibacillus humi]|uniref:hypothetical protein n=1 Tax=Compostibacillus humi TaxID=1245525 RepID=UPI001E3F46A6